MKNQRAYYENNLKIPYRMMQHRLLKNQLKKALRSYNDDQASSLVHEIHKAEMELLSFVPPTFFKQITEFLKNKS